MGKLMKCTFVDLKIYQKEIWIPQQFFMTVKGVNRVNIILSIQIYWYVRLLFIVIKLLLFQIIFCSKQHDLQLKSVSELGVVVAKSFFFF